MIFLFLKTDNLFKDETVVSLGLSRSGLCQRTWQ